MFKKDISHTIVLGRQESFLEVGSINYASRMILYISQALLFVGFGLIVMDTMDMLTPGKYIGSEIWASNVIFTIGLIMSFFCVPFLYWSSYKKFSENDNFWDKETFWILPFFFFGAFFQYLSSISTAFIFIPASLLLSFIIHIRVMALAKDVIEIGGETGNVKSYLENLIYLTAYYLISLVSVMSFDIFSTFKDWIY